MVRQRYTKEMTAEQDLSKKASQGKYRPDVFSVENSILYGVMGI